jgi:hypothetical protein
MRQLSPAGQEAVNELARRHGFSPEAVASMLSAVANGNGVMAQFNHPEFGGSGQWMRGGMTMIGDMFNNFLKGRVDALCADLSDLLARQPGFMQAGSFQSQSQGGQSRGGFAGAGAASLFVPASGGLASGAWWPAELGSPNSAGAQNNVRYAYFAAARRLAIEVNGTVTVYDTLDHQIGGFSQQQSVGGSLSFVSQHGLVDVGTLPIVTAKTGGSQPRSAERVAAASAPQTGSQGMSLAGQADIFAAIEKLSDLRARGILSDDEFNSKKAELLSRI